jgi:hypothetical protein
MKNIIIQCTNVSALQHAATSSQLLHHSSMLCIRVSSGCANFPFEFSNHKFAILPMLLPSMILPFPSYSWRFVKFVSSSSLSVLLSLKAFAACAKSCCSSRREEAPFSLSFSAFLRVCAINVFPLMAFPHLTYLTYLTQLTLVAAMPRCVHPWVDSFSVAAPLPCALRGWNPLSLFSRPAPAGRSAKNPQSPSAF